ncbi:MAG: BlaI/MecI/CopY family transcriptional regulator [Firmicutes bacterium]|nr:BlaI/MecI/CopY family transcriptional regulator [Bacillota bacterium]
MKSFELGELQERFADIVWEHEPIASGELAKICERELNWKRPTTYTVLRKLCEKGVFANRDGIVVSLVSRGEFYSAKSKRIIEESYRGSLPEFIAAFTDQNSLSAQDIDEIQELINKYKRDNNI